MTDKNKIIILGLAALIVLFMLVSTIAGNLDRQYIVPTEPLNNVFIDLDGDGDTDYLVNGEVIYNRANGGNTIGTTEGK